MKHLFSLFLLLLITASTVHARQASPPPNVIFIMTDDQGYGDAGFMGHPVLITPHLDAMAESGLLLDRFYAAAPVCSPTRASVLSGRHPNRSGTFLWGHALRPGEPSIASAVREAGYRTGFFGKWHIGSIVAGAETNPEAHGFDTWYAAPNFYTNDPWMSHNGRPVQLPGEGSAVTVDVALSFIDDAVAGDAPFMAFIWLGAPHVPHEATEELLELYPDHPEPLRNYYGEISGIDRAVGNVRAHLAKLGIAEQTLLWFTSDNGGRLPEASNGILRGQKSDVYEGGIRVPALLEWPGTVAPGRSSVPASTVDFYPTVRELAGLPPAGGARDGISLVPLLKGEMHVREKPMGFWHHTSVPGQIMRSDEIVQNLAKVLAGEPDVEVIEARINGPDGTYPEMEQFAGAAAWIDGDWKLVRVDDAFELYLLADDPREQHNLENRHPDRVRQMKASLQQWQESVVRSLKGLDD